MLWIEYKFCAQTHLKNLSNGLKHCNLTWFSLQCPVQLYCTLCLVAAMYCCVLMDKYITFRSSDMVSHHPLMFPPGYVLWQILFHLYLVFHKHFSYVCVYSYCFVYLPSFGVPSGHLFYIFIFMLSDLSYCPPVVHADIAILWYSWCDQPFL